MKLQELEIKMISGLLNLAQYEPDEYKRTLAQVLQLYKPEMILHEACKNIYQEMKNSLDRNSVINEDTAFQKFNINPEIFVGTASDNRKVLDIAEAISERRNKLVLTKLATAIKDKIETTPVKELVQLVSRKILEISTRRRKRVIDFKQMKEAYLEYISNPEQSEGIKTGFEKLDNHLHGLHPGNLIIIAARPSEGKTTLAINLMMKIMFQKKRCLFFSYEMNEKEVFRVMVSANTVAPVPQHAMKYHLTKENYQKSIKILEDFNDYFLFRDVDEEEHTIEDLKAETRAVCAEKEIDLLVIDYLQLIKFLEKKNDKRLEIGAISRKLKLFAKELEIPIILISQLSRAVEARRDKRPMLSDLKESGDIEQDADTVLFIYDTANTRQDGDENSGYYDNTTEIIVAKARGGQKGSVKMKYYKDTAKFCEVS